MCFKNTTLRDIRSPYHKGHSTRIPYDYHYIPETCILLLEGKACSSQWPEGGQSKDIQKSVSDHRMVVYQKDTNTEMSCEEQKNVDDL